MKLCRPKNILAILIFIFLFFNSIFLLKYLIDKDKTDDTKKEKGVSEVEFLKSIVDFNHTSFVSQGLVHFYYPANQKLNFLNYSIETQNNKSVKDSPKCEFYFDSDEKVFLDSTKRICISDDFDFKTECCKETLSENINVIQDSKCDEATKCCSREYSCILSCITNKQNMSFKQCRKSCKISIITNNYKKPYCSFTDEDLIQTNIFLLYSK